MSHKFLCATAGYGFVRGIVKTHNAVISDYDENFNKTKRPIMTVERIGAVAFSTILGVGGTPLFLFTDIYNLEYSLRGYYKHDRDYNSFLDPVFH
jgi:hypothetical protein